MAGTAHEASRHFAVDVVRQLRRAGFDAFWAGGCVRDHLIGRTPKDYDVATSARPEQVRDLFGHRRTIPVGQAFGVITVLGPEPAAPIEVATFREDVGYSDGRHPDAVVFSNAQADAQRRDFTINGLFYDPLNNQVIDFVGGRADLESGIIRAIGNPSARFEEDRLRILRAIRFAADFSFQIDPATIQAIVAHQDGIAQVSTERIAAELRRMLAHPRRAEAVRVLHETGLGKRILPELSSTSSHAPPPLLDATLRSLALADFPTALSLWIATAFLDSSNPRDPHHQTRRPKEIENCGRSVAQRLKLTNEERDAILATLDGLPRVLAAEESRWPDLQPLLAGPHAVRCVEAARAWSEGRDLPQSGIAWCDARLAWPREQLNPPPLVSGHDLRRLGIPPGKTLGSLLAELRRQQLIGACRDQAQALAWAQSQLTGFAPKQP